MLVSGQDWEERCKLGNGVSQSFKISSISAHWVDVGWGGGARRGLTSDEAGMLGRVGVWKAFEMCSFNVAWLPLNPVPSTLPPPHTPATSSWVYLETCWENTALAMDSQ